MKRKYELGQFIKFRKCYKKNLAVDYSNEWYWDHYSKVNPLGLNAKLVHFIPVDLKYNSYKPTIAKPNVITANAVTDIKSGFIVGRGRRALVFHLLQQAIDPVHEFIAPAKLCNGLYIKTSINSATYFVPYGMIEA